ncbi:MAG: ribulose bisphosphate carboxylase small subunit [bacterium]
MAQEVRDYPSRMDDIASKKFETFSYLPAMDEESIRKQIKYMVDKGWNPAIEHVEPVRAGKDYWYMWKLPMFGEKNVDTIMKELAACRDSNPGHHVRILGYDNSRQTRGQAMVVYRGE